MPKKKPAKPKRRTKTRLMLLYVDHQGKLELTDFRYASEKVLSQAAVVRVRETVIEAKEPKR